MTSRSSHRSASISIPRAGSSASSSARNLDNLISIPGTSAASRSRTTISHDHFSHDRPAFSSNSGNTAGPSSRPLSRSYTHASGVSTNVATQPRRIEPRIIRPDSVACGISTSISPTRTRKTSTIGSRPPSSAPLPPAQQHGNVVSSSHATFPRPSYLEHSAFRNMLHTSAPSNSGRGSTEGLSHELPTFRGRASTPSDSDDSGMSLPLRESHVPRAPHIPKDHVLRLPTRWSEKIRHPSLSISLNGRDLIFEGTSCSGDRDAASARTNYSIPPACGIYYYEVRILSKGQAGHISIGFAGPEVRTSRLPGWEPNSWGYHGDDGRSFAAEKSGTPYGPPFGTGDVIGCGIDFSIGRAFYTRNGSFLGYVFDNVGKTVDLYPAIGLRHHGESVQVNFGHEPFVFTIDFHVRQQKQAMWSRFMTMPINARALSIPNASVHEDSKDGITQTPRTPPNATEEQAKAYLNKLIASYLTHHGYSKTLKAFDKQQQQRALASRIDGDVDMDTVVKIEEGTVRPEEEIEIRTRLVKSVVAGDLNTVLADIEHHYPSVLTADSGLILFKLRCRKFVEMLLEAAELKKRLSHHTTLPPVEKVEDDGIIDGHMDGVDDAMDGMDVDGVDGRAANGTNPSALLSTSSTSFTSADAQYETATAQAIAYGQEMEAMYSKDPRPEVQDLWKKTTSMVAFWDPLEDGAAAAEFAGQQSRIALANELNRAILRSQGQPGDPALEMLYRHTSTCVTELGLLGVGSAAFADMPKEFLEA